MRTNQETLRLIKLYQSCPFVHPLTCGNDSQTHELLKGIEIRGKVVLICPDCDYVQTWVPDFIEVASTIMEPEDILGNLHPDLKECIIKETFKKDN